MAHKAPLDILNKIKDLVLKYDDFTHQLSQPDVISDRDRFSKLSKERTDLEPIVHAYQTYMQQLSSYEGAVQMMQNENDSELRALAADEAKTLEPILDEQIAKLQLLLLPKDPNDDKNVIVEIRAGVGGDEAGLFVADMYKAYSRYAEKRGWSQELLSLAENSAGGYREVVFSISGNKVYSVMKYESGVHRVQRVPKTETQGRIHTSTVTVAVLPEAEEIDLVIEPKDLRIDVFRSGGHGGQSVNTTDSAVRITHLPTGEVVVCQDEKSQIKNKAKAMKVLRTRLLDRMQQEKAEKESAERKAQIGTGFRNERIRTYNYPQSRVTDHRIGLTVHNLDAVMSGDFFEISTALQSHYQLEALKKAQA